MDILKKVNYVFEKKQRRQVLILFAEILLGTVFELIGVTAILPFVNAILSPNSIFETSYLNITYNFFGFTSTNNFLMFLSVFLIVIYILKNAYLGFLYNRQFQFTGVSERILATKMLDSYMAQPYLFFTKHNSAELIRNVGTDTMMFYRAVLAGLQMVTELCVCLALVIFLFITDKEIMITISLIMLILVLFFLKQYKMNLRKLGEKARVCNGNYNKWMLQAFGGIKEIQILDKEKFFVNHFSEQYKGYANAHRKYSFLGLAPKLLLETICIGGLLIAICFKIYMGVNTTTFIPSISAFAIAAFRMLPSFNKITLNLSTLMFSKDSINAVYTDLKEIEDLQQVYKNTQVNDKNFSFQKGIFINKMSFQYPETDKKVLDTIDMQIPKNKSVAFVGPSGAGKTTLADIILGVLEPNSGGIYSDSYNVHDNLEAWHKKLGYIPQNIYLIDDTLRNNIAFGIEEENIDEQRVLKALEEAQLKDFALSLENGLDTEIGERGIRLSGGQRQRIGIARALYNNPEILVLDEATSALDTDTETAVMDAINSLSGTKTLIIIAHRLTTIEKCDIVYEIKDGQVIRKNR